MAAARAGSALVLFTAAAAFRLPHPQGTYVWHEACRTADGLGGHVIKVRPYIAVAMHNNFTFVCNPKDWDTELHNTGNLGSLFGCNGLSQVVGAFASYESVKNLDWRPFPRELLAVPGTVYSTKECKSMPPWGESWRWFRTQYWLVRNREHRDTQCWGADQAVSHIVLAIRKGDSPSRSRDAKSYLLVLEAVFRGLVPRVALNENSTRVVVISEAPAHNKDIRELNRSLGTRASFFIGDPETSEPAARARFIRDLDCMAQSDVLVLSDSGMSDLAAAVQQPRGISLLVENRVARRNTELPNTAKIFVNSERGKVLEAWPAELPNALHVSVG